MCCGREEILRRWSPGQKRQFDARKWFPVTGLVPAGYGKGPPGKRVGPFLYNVNFIAAQELGS